MNMSPPCRSSLQSVGLVGPLPEALGGLRRLEVLNLESNQLTGTLPAAWGSTNTLSRLQQLLLSGNRLGGDLPTDWGRPNRWPALASLQMGSNNFTGGMPASWAGTGQSQQPRAWTAPCRMSPCSSPSAFIQRNCAALNRSALHRTREHVLTDLRPAVLVACSSCGREAHLLWSSQIETWLLQAPSRT